MVYEDERTIAINFGQIVLSNTGRKEFAFDAYVWDIDMACKVFVSLVKNA